MKNKSLLFLFLSIIIFSCKKDNSTEPIDQEPISQEDAIQNEIDLLPEITVSEIEQINFTKMDVGLTINNVTSTYNLLLDYDDSNRLKSVYMENDTLYSYNYQADRVNVLENGISKTIYLNDDGIARQEQGLTNEFKYYFKNDYLLKTTEVSRYNMEYSTDGNLIHYQNGSLTADYTYIDSTTNNIRQEILTPLTFHWSFRDKYLGNFSTNLLKTAVFHDEDLDYDYTLAFSYEYDELERVSKVIINRQAEPESSLIEYKLSY
ncbi:hypothetical protein [uncultured Arcticibacterium sp.]|uniref:hypothetical protein n=1 Tax=uncultured Arcticibacterium sp. TaxID=2173042 RepID=UPI0030F87FFF